MARLKQTGRGEGGGRMKELMSSSSWPDYSRRGGGGQGAGGGQGTEGREEGARRHNP